MASTYAHYRFGRAVYEKLPRQIQEQIKKEEALYLIGLHGPDILFYYQPLSKNPVNRCGYGMHDYTGRAVFTDMYGRRCHLQGAEQEAVQAYIYGFICHFALDRNVHPFIEQWEQQTGLSHAEIEVEFDRALMVQDGLNPVRQRLTNHISTDLRTATVIQCIFSEFSVETVQKALSSMRFYNDLLVAPNPLKRGAIKGLLLLSGKFKTMAGLMVNYRPNPKCRASNDQLLELYQQSVDLAVTLITEMDAAFVSGALTLNKAYNHTFGAV